MRSICLIGHQGITKFLLDNLLKNKFNVTHIVCTDILKEDEVIDHYDFLSQKKNYKKIKIYKCENYSLKSTKDQKNILKFDADIFVVFGWSRLIPNWLISGKKHVIGMHGGMYKPPRCRGRAVFNWALIGGYKKFYLYVMLLDEGVDSGKILSIDVIKISDYDDIETLYLKYAINGTKQIKSVISSLGYNKGFVKINKLKPTYLPKRNPEDGFINLLAKDFEIVNFVKAIKFPYPGAFLVYKKIKIIIDDLIPFDVEQKSTLNIGSIVNVFENKMFTVKSKHGILLIKKWKSDNLWNPKEGYTLMYSRENDFKKLKKII